MPGVYLQFIVNASDGRGNTAQAAVEIEILRNPDDTPPVFIGTDSDGLYRVGVQFDEPLGYILPIDIRANDSDRQVNHTFLL